MRSPVVMFHNMDRTAENVNPVLVDDQKSFDAAVERWLAESRVAIDTEAASFHRYNDRIYLLQVSTPHDTFIIDPLAVTNLAGLGTLLEASSIEKVFHDADYDLRVLHRDYGFRAARLFDTRISAQLLGEKAVGLGALLEKHFGVTLDKRMQRADWSRRPLTEAMIRYAGNDTHYLLDLRDILEHDLTAVGRMHWAQEEFVRLEHLEWAPNADPSNAFLRIKRAKTLPSRNLAVLRALHAWRDDVARRLDRAPFRVLGNDALLTLARAAPSSSRTLAELRGVPASIVKRHGAELQEVIARGLAEPKENWPRIERGRRPRPDPDADQRLEALRHLRAQRSKEIGLEIGVVCPNGTLQAIARSGLERTEDLTHLPELRRWQIEVLGPDSLNRILNPAG